MANNESMMEIAAALRELVPKASRRAIRTLSKHVAQRAVAEDAGLLVSVGRDVLLIYTIE